MKIKSKLFTRFSSLIALTLLPSIALFVGFLQMNEINAGDSTEKEYMMANDISIHTIFTFNEVVEESDGFQVFIQKSGFDLNTESPVFKLEGVIDFDRIYLYEAADAAYLYNILPSQYNYGKFDVDVYLHQEDVTFRHFKYSDCHVSQYKVDTLFDKEEGWTTSRGFVIIDEFEFACNGYSPNNPLYELMKTNEYSVNSTVKSTNDLDKNPVTWEEHPKFKWEADIRGNRD